jgi:hypothetical protein
MKDKKDFNSTNGSKGKTKGINTKKNKKSRWGRDFPHPHPVPALKKE